MLPVIGVLFNKHSYLAYAVYALVILWITWLHNILYEQFT